MTPKAASPWPRRTALAAGAAYVVLTVLVAGEVTQALDTRAVEWFRPDGEWGRTQAVLEPIIDFFEPRRIFVFLAVVGGLVSLRRASLWPGVYAALVALAVIGLTLATKFALQRPDPRGEMSGIGGSYPSGHVAALLVCLGCCALILWQRSRWWHWGTVALFGLAMVAALLFTAAHWPTDALGGALLAVALLAGASTFSLRSGTAETHAPVREPRG